MYRTIKEGKTSAVESMEITNNSITLLFYSQSIIHSKIYCVLRRVIGSNAIACGEKRFELLNCGS